MREFRAKITENGRILIPAACRRLLDIKTGDDVVLLIKDHELRVFSLKHALQKAKALVRLHTGKRSLVKQLKTMRNLEKD